MICHGFKGGIGTASRAAPRRAGTVGVLVQATTAAASSCASTACRSATSSDADPCRCRRPPDRATGSIIVVVRHRRAAAPAPVRAARAARRARHRAHRRRRRELERRPDALLRDRQHAGSGELDGVRKRALTRRSTTLFYAVIDATEGAIVNALLHAETTTGRNGRTVYAFRSG